VVEVSKVEVSKREIVPKIRKIGEYSMLIQNRYVLILFRITAEDTVNKRRIVEVLKEIRGLAKALLDSVDELLRELEEEEQ
jgi:hypothetical protein